MLAKGKLEWTVQAMRLKRTLIIGMSLMLTISGLFTINSFVKGGQGLSDQEIDMRLGWVAGCMDGVPAVNEATGEDFGSRQNSQLLCALDAFGKPKNIKDVSSMVVAVVEASKDDLALRSACHDLLHEIGVYAWRIGKEDALVPDNFTCGMGYYHGLMSEALLGEKERVASIDRLVVFCQKMVKQGGEVDQGKNYQCAHGVGHAIGNVIQDLKAALPLCDQVVLYSADWDRRLCFTGALNQFVVMNPLETADPDFAVERCQPFDGFKRTDCYTFALYNLRAGSDDIKAYCATLTEEFSRNGCWRGAGMFESHQVIFAGDRAIGHELIKDPIKFANYMMDACAGDPTANCVAQLSAEAAEQVLDPELMGRTCVELRTDQMRNECKGVVNAMRSVHTL